MPWAVDNEQRRRQILGFIIGTYISTAEPVSSRAICRKHKLGLCTATVRNVMADLEELGLVTHPHTSAGRIPTDIGYRFYVDFLLEELMPTQEEKEHIIDEFGRIEREIEKLLVKTCNLLAEMTKCAALISFPQIEKSKLKRIDLIALEGKRVVVVVVSNSGVVKHAIVKLKVKIEDEDLKQLVRFLNAELHDVELDKVRQILMQKFLAEKGEFAALLKNGLELLDLSALVTTYDRLYIDGREYLFEQPEFRDVEKTRKLIRLMETKQQLFELMQRGAQNHSIKIYIGKENKYDEIKDCTAVVANYGAGSNIIGAVGVLGPKRMNYSKVISLVNYVSRTLGEALEEISI